MKRDAIVLAAAAALAVTSAVWGEETIYRWTDDRGVIHFSDVGVPGRYARDAEEKTVEPRRRRRSTEPRAAASIPLTVRDGKRYVRVTLEGTYRTRDMLMLVDTGAQNTMIDEEVAENLNLEFMGDAGIVGATGVAKGWVGRLRGLRLGDDRVSDLPVIVGPLPGVHLMGTDVLDRLGLTIGPNELRKD